MEPVRKAASTDLLRMPVPRILEIRENTMTEQTPAPNDVERETSSSQNSAHDEAASGSKGRTDSDDPTTAEGNSFSPDIEPESEAERARRLENEETDADIDTAGG
jgi:hypothetical protein